MNCPDCKNQLSCTARAEFKDAPYIVDHQWLQCRRCSERFFGILTEDKTHIFDDDFHYVGYRVSARDWKATRSRPGQCPEPLNSGCSCPVHEMLRAGTRVWSEF